MATGSEGSPEQRLGRIRRLAPVLISWCLVVLVAAVLEVGLSPRRWAAAGALLVAFTALHLVRFRRVRADGVIFIHHLGDGILALSIVVGLDPFLAAVGVSVSCLVVDFLGNAERRRMARHDWQRRVKLNVTTAVNTAAAVATWATTSAASHLLPADHALAPMVVGLIGGLTYGAGSGMLLGPIVGWVSTGRPRTPWAELRFVMGPTLTQSAAGAVLGLLLIDVHPGALVVTALALWPLPHLIRRRNQLEEEHQQVLRLMALAADTEALDEGAVAEAVAAAIAALLHYHEAEIRSEPPVAPTELGAHLHDGSWLVLSNAINLDLPDPEDQPRLDGLGALAGTLIESARRRVRRNLEVQTDALTGLANRTGLALAVEGLGRDEPVVAVFLDLNGFKPLNDTYGHDAGDLVLVEIGRRLVAELREIDVAARVGGDEFVLALPGITDPYVAEEVASRLTAAIAVPVTLEHGTEVAVTAAAGFAVGTVAAFEHLVSAADRAMYADKRRRTGNDEPGRLLPRT